LKSALSYMSIAPPSCFLVPFVLKNPFPSFLL
jgi:hypothetical protein